MTATLQSPWGADGTDVANNAPNSGAWGYLTNMMGNSAANVVATGKGWATEFPNGSEEVLIAIGGLVTTLLINFVHDQSGVVGHTASETLKIFVQMKYGVNITDANSANVYIVAITDVANTANVNLAYSPADSKPESGELVFKATALDLSGYGAGAHFTINNSSTIHNPGAIVARKPTHSTVNATTTLIATSVANTNVVITTV